MQKIRVTKTPKTGDQRDYSLVHRQVHYIGEGDSNTLVKNTMGAVPKEEANIEVEGGETVVGDVNRDGFLEHMTFVGKKHSQGGVPVNIPEGSFIFSDTKKLKIKDREILDKIFGLSFKKGGYTPAEIAKRYQINNYIQDLKSEDSDPITKRSATQMLANNMEKLGQLALIQESMKGFPDGIPAIAESVMAGLQESMPQEQPAQMRMGGMMKFDNGGNPYTNPSAGTPTKGGGNSKIAYVPGQKFYINGQQAEIVKLDEKGYVQAKVKTGNGGATFYNIPKTYFETNFDTGKQFALVGNEPIKYINPATEKKFQDRVIPDMMYSKAGYGVNSLRIGSTPQEAPDNTTMQVSGVGQIKNNQVIVVGNQKYQVMESQWSQDGKKRGVLLRPYDESKGLYRPALTAISTPASRYDRYANTTYLSYDQIREAQANNTLATYDQQGNVVKFGQNSAPAAAKPAATSGSKPAATKPAATGAKPAGTAPAKPTGKPKTAQDALNYFKSGGELAMYVDGGPGDPQNKNAGTLNTTVANQQQMQQNVNQRVDPNKEIFVGDIQLEDGTIVKAYYKGSQKLVKDASGNVLATGTRTDTQFEQYGSSNINQILAQTPNVKYTTTNFGTFGRQPIVGNTGIYLSTGNKNARPGDLAPEEWQDFKDRHGDWIEKEYPGGFQKYQDDLRASKASGNQAAAWFQDKINEKSMKQFGVPYFAALNGKEDNPYKRDSKFGQVTYSVPRFFDLPETPPETPPQTPPETPPQTPPQTPPADVPPPTPPKQGPWWIQDIVNFVGTMTDQNNRYEPSQGKVALQTPGYVTEDPTRRLAANQEQMARMQDQTMNTTDGNVGLASMLGASGQGFANAANVLGEVENRNVGIVNQAYDRNAQIVNQETLANENARQKYVQDMAVLNQQEDNADQQLKWRQIAAFNNGTTNYFRKKQMEQVLFPTVYTDPISGDVSFSGNGRNPDPTMIDTYSPAYAGNTAGATGINVNSSLQAYQDAYDQAVPTMGPEKAKEYALSVSRAVLTQQGKMASGMGMTPRQQYAQMAQQGLTLPAPLPGGEYGGIMTFPWQDID